MSVNFKTKPGVRTSINSSNKGIKDRFSSNKNKSGVSSTRHTNTVADSAKKNLSGMSHRAAGNWGSSTGSLFNMNSLTRSQNSHRNNSAAAAPNPHENKAPHKSLIHSPRQGAKKDINFVAANRTKPYIRSKYSSVADYGISRFGNETGLSGRALQRLWERMYDDTTCNCSSSSSKSADIAAGVTAGVGLLSTLSTIVNNLFKSSSSSTSIEAGGSDGGTVDSAVQDCINSMSKAEDSATLEAKIEEATDKLKDTRSEKTEVAKKKAESQDKKNAAQTSLDNIKTSITEKNTALSAKESTLAKLKSQTNPAALQSEINTLKEEIKKLKEEQKTKENEIKQCDEEIQQCEKQEKNLETTEKALDKEIPTQRKRLKELKKSEEKEAAKLNNKSSKTEQQENRAKLLSCIQNGNKVSYNGQSFATDGTNYVVDGKLVEKSEFQNAIKKAWNSLQQEINTYTSTHQNDSTSPQISSDSYYTALTEKLSTLSDLFTLGGGILESYEYLQQNKQIYPDVVDYETTLV